MRTFASGFAGGLASAATFLLMGQVVLKRDSNPEKLPVIKYEYRQDRFVRGADQEDFISTVKGMLDTPRYQGFEPVIWWTYDQKTNVTLGRDRHQTVLSVIWRRAVHMTRA